MVRPKIKLNFKRNLQPTRIHYKKCIFESFETIGDSKFMVNTSFTCRTFWSFQTFVVCSLLFLGFPSWFEFRFLSWFGSGPCSGLIFGPICVVFFFYLFSMHAIRFGLGLEGTAFYKILILLHIEVYVILLTR